MSERPTPFYKNPRGNITFESNLHDGPDAYDIWLGNAQRDHFYLPPRILPQLVSASATPESVRQALSNIDPTILSKLEMNSISLGILRIALFRVAQKQEEEYQKSVLKENKGR